MTGQDGGYLAERLVAEGCHVHGTMQVGEQVPEHIQALGDAVTLHENDLRDAQGLAGLLGRVRPQEIYNLAGVSSVAMSWEQPVLTAEVNAVAVAALLQGVRDLQERTGEQIRFLQASSAELFAGSTTVPQDESTPITPRSPYGAAKAYGHHLVELFRQVGVHATSVILYNHESPRRPTTFVTRKITSTVAAIADGRTQTLTLGTLTQRRDWGWAPEYVDAMVLALRHDRAEDFVLATGVGHSVEDFVATAFAHVGITDWQRHLRTDAAFTRAGDPVELVGNAAKARRLLGWEPTVGFDKLVGRMVDADRRAAPSELTEQA
ncbi:MAG: GDP-mannose 4,6-dehydratase [Mycobacteriales bacterium]